MSEFNLSLGRKGKAGEFDSTDIKDGTKKKDLKSKISQNIFDAFDNDKDGALNEIEIEKLLAQLKDAAKNDNLSKREAKKLLKLEGLKGVKAEKLFEFLKEVAAVEVEDDYSAYKDGMGVDIKTNQNPQEEVAEEEFTEENPDEEIIDNTKAYFKNGRVMTLGDDGKSILVQENENSEPVKLQVDEEGNVISYAKNGESFKMTAKRLGIPTDGPEYEKFKELNEKASKKGYFLVGGKVIVPSDAVENLALDKVNVNPDNEIAAYTKFMSNKKAEAEKAQEAQKTKDISDEEFRKKYPGIAKPDENTKYEPPKWEIPAIPGMPVTESKSEDKPVDTKPQGGSEKTDSSVKTPEGNPKKLAVTMEDFKIENIKKRYPEDKYNESTNDEGITSFTDKKSGKIVFGISHSETGDMLAILYKNGKIHNSIHYSKAENTFTRQQHDENEDIKSQAFYDAGDGKIKRELLAKPDGTITNAITYNINGNKTEEKIYRSDNDDNDYEIEYYQNDGTLISTYNGKTENHNCPIANELQDFIYAKNSMGLPVSKDKEIKETVLKKINLENISVILEAYKKSTGVDLLQDISDEWAISSSDLKEIKDHIKKCAETKHEYKSDFENPSSQVKNEFHTGPEFSVKQKNDVITVKNKSTGKEHSIDLNKLLRIVSPDKQVKLKQVIQNLPGEVLEDLSIEVDTLYEAEQDGNTGAFYNEGADTISIFNIFINGSDSISMIDINQNNLVHEIGHAVDFNGYFSNTSTIGDNKNFVKVNEQEMEKYVEAGNKRFDVNDNTTHLSNDKTYNYCTMSDLEMFAECYSLLMTGECNSKECILKYFPETLKAVKEHINNTRKLPESKRH